MAKSRYFSIAGDSKRLDLAELSKRLKKQVLANAEDFVDDEVNFVIEKLENLLEELGQTSPNRGRGFFSVKYNQPIAFENSPIKIRKRINRSTGQYTVELKVDNDKFNILDLGAPARDYDKDKPAKFPRYDRARTSPNSLSMGTTKIIDNRSFNQPARAGSIETRFQDQPKVIGGWVTTTHVEALKPRNFMIQIAKEVRSRRTAFGARSLFVKILVKKG